MDLNILKIFYTVAKEKSMSKAADKLHCVQSNVSARIKQLEEDLNISLFNRRGGRKLTLTPAGKTLFLFAEKIAVIEKEAEKNYKRHKRQKIRHRYRLYGNGNSHKTAYRFDKLS